MVAFCRAKVVLRDRTVIHGILHLGCFWHCTLVLKGNVDQHSLDPWPRRVCDVSRLEDNAIPDK